MAVLITGGTGFLGAYLGRYAVEQGADVVVLDRYADRGRVADVLDRITLVEGDVSDIDVVRAVIRDHGVDRVAHFAAILGSPSQGPMVPGYSAVQCVGTANVFEAAREAGLARVVFSSSVSAYGRQDVTPLTEDLPANATHMYGASKLWAEALGRFYTDQLGLDVVALRFASVYGLGRARRGSYDSGLLDRPQQTHYMARVDDAVRGIPIELPRDDVAADWTYAADAAQAAWLALTVPDHRYGLYNVCSERRPIGEFTEALRTLLPDAQIATSSAEMPGNAHPAMDNSRLVDDLGFEPAYTIEAGVRDYIARVRAYDRYQLERAEPSA